MNRRAAIPLILGLVIGLVAVKFVMDSVRRAQASSQAKQTVTAVQAKQDINAYEEIRPEMVQAVETVDSQLTPSNERLSAVDQVVGRVTAKPIPQNAPVLKSMLAAEGTRPGMVGRIPTGFRAVSVKIDEVTGVAYQIQPGDWVDVIVTMDIDSGSRAKKETISEVILQHVQVAAIGQGTNPEPEGTGGKVKPAKSATLLVKEDDVPRLHLAATRGKLTLALRGEDDKTTGTPAVAYSSQISSTGKGTDEPPVAPQPVPVEAPRTALPPPQPPVTPLAPPPPPYEVAVYRGTTVGNQPTTIERVIFENAKSNKVIEVAPGAPSRASRTLGGAQSRADQRPARQNEGAPLDESQTPGADGAGNSKKDQPTKKTDDGGFPADEDFDVEENNPKND